jgi:glutathione S-transferase
MQPILFFGVPEGCSFGSIVALEWLGRPYRLCRIQMPEVVSSTAYRRINPVGETPTLLTAAGELVSESMAILNHLGTQGIEQRLWFSQGSSAFDRANQVLAFLNTSFFNAFSPLWYAVEHGTEGPARDALVGYGRAMVEKAHAHLEGLLGGNEWLLGEHRSLADAYFMGIARWADFHQVVDRRDYPGLHGLHERLLADPAVRLARAVEHGDAIVKGSAFRGYVSIEEALSLLPRS